MINLPLRLPSVLAKSAASLDILSDGRVEIGIGAGGFRNAVVAMGGPRRSPRESVDALEEAIGIIRDFWDGADVIRRDGEHSRVVGARPGPPPAHRIGLWVGAYGPRMLRLTGRRGDGWLPSLGGNFAQPHDVPSMHAAIDDARAAGRDPSEIRRAVNVMSLGGDPGSWTDRLTGIVAELGSRRCSSELRPMIPSVSSAGSARRSHPWSARA